MASAAPKSALKSPESARQTRKIVFSPYIESQNLVRDPEITNLFFTVEELGAQQTQARQNAARGINTTRRLSQPRAERNAEKVYRRRIIQQMKRYANTGNEAELARAMGEIQTVSQHNAEQAQRNAAAAAENARLAWMTLPKPTGRPGRGAGSRGSAAPRKTRRNRRRNRRN